MNFVIFLLAVGRVVGSALVVFLILILSPKKGVFGEQEAFPQNESMGDEERNRLRTLWLISASVGLLVLVVLLAAVLSHQ